MQMIHFGKNAIGWCKNPELNKHFLRQQVYYLKEKCRFREYIYLNQIYEDLGVTWDPERDNICYLSKNGELWFDIIPAEEENEWIIKIEQI